MQYQLKVKVRLTQAWYFSTQSKMFIYFVSDRLIFDKRNLNVNILKFYL